MKKVSLKNVIFYIFWKYNTPQLEMKDEKFSLL